MQQTNTSLIELFLPDGTLEWFDIVNAKKDNKEIHITLEEKNIIPLPVGYKGEKIISKGLQDITVTDFPIRGRKTLLTFRRRYWKIAGRKGLLKRDIKLCAPGTRLEQEFADFLKDKGRIRACISGFYRQITANFF